jgi:catecholate siderophore receptor
VSSKSIAAASISAIALLAMAGTAQAEEAEDQSTILVIGKAEGYVAKETVTATKTDTPLIDVPQTVNVITREQIEDQAQHSIADVLRYVPGVTIGQGEGNRDQITLRGQNTTADFFLDGVRDDVQYYRNLYNIERVEVLKGPYALIFGRGGGGGIVNRVQKAPSAERFFATASGSVNTFGAWDVAADVNAPIGAGGALRVNAFYENLDNHRDFFGGERYAFNPYLAFELGAGWQAGLSYEYVKDDRVTDRGVPALACTQPCTPMPLTGHDSTFFGVPGVNRTGVEGQGPPRWPTHREPQLVHDAALRQLR